MKKILIVAHYSRFLVQFELNDVHLLQNMGYEVHYATNYENEDMYAEAPKTIQENGVILHQIDFVRSPYALLDNIKAYRQLKSLMEKEQFSGVHCHTPMAGALARLAANATHTRPVLYTAHGFHFYKGCPLKNRLIYETAEKFLARYTDAQITINQEDFTAAQSFPLRGKAYKVPGIGINIRTTTEEERTSYKENARKKLKLPPQAYVFISVGEINDNKNHATAIRAFAKANFSDAYYLICGEGKKSSHLKELCESLGIEERVLFLGFRTDVKELLYAADAFVFPSYREGLSVALMEAMSANLPCIASYIRGNIDLLPNSKLLFNPHDADALCSCMKLVRNPSVAQQEVKNNAGYITNFSSEKVTEKMKKIYTEWL